MPPREAPSPFLVLVAVSIPLAVLSVDFTGVVVALPTIADDLGVDPAATPWVINAFALGFAGPLLVVGRLSDGLGHRRVLQIGLATFAVGALVCGLASSFGVLVAGRVVQGVGTACAMTASLALVAAAFEGPARGRAVGRWSAVGGTASAVGPLVAGALTVAVSWRGFFLIDLPLLAVAGVLSRQLPAPRTTRWRFQDLDAAGTVLSVLGLVAVVAGLVAAGDQPLRDPSVFVPLTVGAGALVLFVVVEHHVAVPLVRPAVLGRAAFMAPVTWAGLANVGFGALELLVTLYLQDLRDWDALETGLAFLAYSVPFAVTGAAMGRLGARWSSGALVRTGLAVIAASFAALTLLDTQPGIVLAGALVLGGIGQGLVYTASSTAAMDTVSTAEEGEASALLGVARNLGLSVGVALASIVTLRATGLVRGIEALALGLAVVTALGALAARPRAAAAPPPSPG